MENHGGSVDIQNVLSLGDDLLRVLINENDTDSLVQFVEGIKTLSSSCQEDFYEVQNLLEDNQKKINACIEGINSAKCETIVDAELKFCQNEQEEKLQLAYMLSRELKIICDELDSLERQKISFEERSKIVKKKEKDVLRAQDLLSMCASVTSIIPNLDEETRISGFVAGRNAKKIEKFELESTLSPFEACNVLWKMAP